jgi:hypothetical protein
MAYLFLQRTPNVQIKCLMFDLSIYRRFVLNKSWKRDSPQMMIFVNVCSTWSMVDLKTRFEKWIIRNAVNGVSLFHLSYLRTLKPYLCSQRTPNLQIKYFMCGWSIYRPFLLSRGRKRDCPQIKIFIFVCSSWSIV